MLDRERCIKNRFISNYFMLVAVKSPVKFSKCFLIVKFHAKYKIVLQKQLFLSIVANHSKSDFSTVKLIQLYLKLNRERHTELCAITVLSCKQPSKLS